MEVKALLREWGIRPQKGLGQSFLADRRVLGHILAAAEITGADTVLEVGPGLGTLTEALAERAGRVVAVELDPQLIPVLQDRLSRFPNTQVILGDVLARDICELLQMGQAPQPICYKVVANIPYNITSALLRHVLEARVRPQLIVLMVQKEVAQRITAQAGAMSLLSVSVQFYGKPRLVHHVPARAFYPAPRVDSAIIRIEPHEQLLLETDQVGAFFDIVRAGFGQRRKQLRNALAHGLRRPVTAVAQAMAQAGIEPERRAQTLSVDEWITLYRAVKDQGWL